MPLHRLWVDPHSRDNNYQKHLVNPPLLQDIAAIAEHEAGDDLRCQAKEGGIDRIRLLLGSKANIDAHGQVEGSALDVSLICRQTSCIELLLQHRCSIHHISDGMNAVQKMSYDSATGFQGTFNMKTGNQAGWFHPESIETLC